MATFSGKDARITVNASTSEAIVAEMSSWSINRKASDVDTTAFGAGWAKSDVGMKSYNGMFKGFFDPTDSNGQGVFESAFDTGALINDVRFYIQYSDQSGNDIKYLAPASGSENGIRITALDVSIDKNNVGQISGSFTGSGPVEVIQSAVPV